MTGPAVFGSNPYVDKTDVVGQVVVVLRGVTDQRALAIEEFRSRAVRRGDVHELMITDEVTDVGITVNRVALLAFFEVTTGGVMLQNDRVTVGNRDVGRVAGFNETHMPNHLNVCLGGSLKDGATLDLQLGDEVRISRA
jgi:hypothetical protein